MYLDENWLVNAENFFEGSSSETERWQISKEKFWEDLTNVTGNIELSSAFVGYLGPCESGCVNEFVIKWM